jgi:3-(methylthio)propanoyl-CoA dehydrogenase
MGPVPLFPPPLEKEEEKRRKQLSRALKRINGMLTPMSKYHCSEMSNRATYNAIQVLGGSGYMKDYAAERFSRDARITTIYEGTSQLQVVAAVRGVTSGSLDNWAEPHEKKTYGDPLLDDLKQKLIAARQRVVEAVQFVKSKGSSYLDLSGRRLVDSAIAIIVGHLLLAQGATNQRKKRVARRFIDRELPVLRTNCEQVLSADMAAMEEYALLAGPVPAAG